MCSFCLLTISSCKRYMCCAQTVIMVVLHFVWYSLLPGPMSLLNLLLYRQYRDCSIIPKTPYSALIAILFSLYVDAHKYCLVSDRWCQFWLGSPCRCHEVMLFGGSSASLKGAVYPLCKLMCTWLIFGWFVLDYKHCWRLAVETVC